MKTYKLSLGSEFAQELLNNVPTGNWVNTSNNQEYLAWLAEGNTPLPADEQGVQQ